MELKNDVVAFQSVCSTVFMVFVTNKVADIIEQWNKEDKYTDAYYLHGLAVEVAEALNSEWIKSKKSKMKF